MVKVKHAGQISGALSRLEMGHRNARLGHAFIHRYLLRPGVSLRQGLPEVEVAPNAH
jgi:hypothetical protein